MARIQQVAIIQQVPAYILCGGRSQRFGTDKARASIDGQPQLLALSHLLRSEGHAVYYLADRADRYRDLGITCLVDTQADSGPLAGLSSALKHRVLDAGRRASSADSDTSGWLLLVSCDQVHWNPQWLAHLSSAIAQTHGARAAAYYDTTWQPLPGLFHVDLVEEVEYRLQHGQLSLQSLLSDLDTRGQCSKVVAGDAPSSWSFNTPEELSKLSNG